MHPFFEGCFISAHKPNIHFLCVPPVPTRCVYVCVCVRERERERESGKLGRRVKGLIQLRLVTLRSPCLIFVGACAAPPQLIFMYLQLQKYMVNRFFFDNYVLGFEPGPAQLVGMWPTKEERAAAGTTVSVPAQAFRVTSASWKAEGTRTLGFPLCRHSAA